MKLIAREPTAEMSAVGGQYPGIGMLGDYESRRKADRMTAPIYCKTPNAAVNCQSCKHNPGHERDPNRRTFDPRANGGNCRYYVMRIDYGIKK